MAKPYRLLMQVDRIVEEEGQVTVIATARQDQRIDGDRRIDADNPKATLSMKAVGNYAEGHFEEGDFFHVDITPANHDLEGADVLAGQNPPLERRG